jgi:hypothetical protein
MKLYWRASTMKYSVKLTVAVQKYLGHTAVLHRLPTVATGALAQAVGSSKFA